MVWVAAYAPTCENDGFTKRQENSKKDLKKNKVAGFCIQHMDIKLADMFLCMFLKTRQGLKNGLFTLLYAQHGTGDSED